MDDIRVDEIISEIRQRLDRIEDLLRAITPTETLYRHRDPRSDEEDS